MDGNQPSPWFRTDSMLYIIQRHEETIVIRTIPGSGVPWCAKDLANHKSLYNLQFGDDQINSLLHVLTTKVYVLWNIYNSGTITSNTT